MKIIVQRGKHGDEYYDASTPDAEGKSFLKMFHNNKEMSYYCDLDDYEEDKKKLEERIEKLSKTASLPSDLPQAVHETLEKELKKLPSLKRDLATLIEDKELYDLSCKGDMKACKRFMNRRAPGEYEGFSIATVK